MRFSSTNKANIVAISKKQRRHPNQPGSAWRVKHSGRMRRQCFHLRQCQGITAHAGLISTFHLQPSSVLSRLCPDWSQWCWQHVACGFWVLTIACTLELPDLLGGLRKKHDAQIVWDTQIRKIKEDYLLISKQLPFWPQKSDENRSKKICAVCVPNISDCEKL